MQPERKDYLIEKFRAAGAAGRKAHVIGKSGKWAVLREGHDSVSSVYVSKKLAITAAKGLVKAGKNDKVVIHKIDGSVEKILSGN